MREIAVAQIDYRLCCNDILYRFVRNILARKNIIASEIQIC